MSECEKNVTVVSTVTGSFCDGSQLPTVQKAHRRLRVCFMKHIRSVLQNSTCQVVLASLTVCSATMSLTFTRDLRAVAIP